MIDSPKILLLSGVGDSEVLREHGISTVLHLSYIGQELKDHPMIRLGALIDNKTFQERPLAPQAEDIAAAAQGYLQMDVSMLSTRLDLDAKVRSYLDKDAQPTHELLLVCAPTSGLQLVKCLADHIVLIACCSWPWLGWETHPRSCPRFDELPIPRESDFAQQRSSRHAVDRSEPAFPSLRYATGYWDHPRHNSYHPEKLGHPDWHVTSGTEVSRWSRYRGTLRPRKSRLQEDANYIQQYIRSTATHLWHGCGTVKMGKLGEKGTCVTSDFKIPGLDGLRVADMSVAPLIPRYVRTPCTLHPPRG